MSEQPHSSISLSLNEVSASYGARIVLRDVSLRLHHGEVLVISGPNGSGKSTLLRLLCGLQRPTTGLVHYQQGHNTYMPGEARHLIGWVAPDLTLYRELSGQENLRFFAAVRGQKRSSSELADLLARVGLGGRDHDHVASYSSGMVQRLRYAYALLHSPPVLLLDEPTVTLDERGAAVVTQVVAEQRRYGLTVIATNDPRELRFGDYVLELHTA
jgi:heme exporter protein A